MARRKPEIMTCADVLALFDDLRSDQIATVMSRRNPQAYILGVRFGDLDRICKRIQRDSELARELWASGSFEARTVAVRIMDPTDLDASTIDAWVVQIDFPTLADEFANLVYRTASAANSTRMHRWTASDAEFVQRVGFALVMALASDATNAEPDASFLAYLEQIERDIHTSPNWARELMNQVPVAIGARNDRLFAAARRTAVAYGTVEVFHGDRTRCRVIDPVETLDRRREQAAIGI